MAKLYFRYGAMNSAKTMNLLAVAHNYRQQGKRPFLIKPQLDIRFGVSQIRSRAGLESEADLLLQDLDSLRNVEWSTIHCALVDEVQFLTSEIIEELRRVATEENVPVICYGLRADFRGKLFEGSKRLFELADTIEEIKTTCAFCNRKAIMNLRHANGKATIEGNSIQLGGDETYSPACYSCYTEKLREGKI